MDFEKEFVSLDEKIDYKAIYKNIIHAVSENINSVLDENVLEKIKELLDWNEPINDDLTSYIEEDENGPICIVDSSYTMPKNVHQIINIACYEMVVGHVKELVAQYSEGKNDAYEKYCLIECFYAGLRKARTSSGNNTAHGERFKYKSKQDYIKFCAKVGVLNAVLLHYSHKSVYKDILENKMLVKEDGV